MVEIQNIYILLKEASRDSSESVSQSQIEKENQAIRNMDLFVVIEYIRSAVKILLQNPSNRQTLNKNGRNTTNQQSEFGLFSVRGSIQNLEEAKSKFVLDEGRQSIASQ